VQTAHLSLSGLVGHGGPPRKQNCKTPQPSVVSQPFLTGTRPLAGAVPGSVSEAGVLLWCRCSRWLLCTFSLHAKLSCPTCGLGIAWSVGVKVRRAVARGYGVARSSCSWLRDSEELQHQPFDGCGVGMWCAVVCVCPECSCGKFRAHLIVGNAVSLGEAA
jgi:hypothetical protein